MTAPTLKMNITLEIPDRLAQKVEDWHHELPQALEIGLQELESREQKKLSLSFEQVLTLIRQFSETEKQKILQELQTEYRRNKLTHLLNEFQTDDLSFEEITQEVEIVRSQNYYNNIYVDSDP